MPLTFQLGTSSADAITILPEYSSVFGEKQLRSEIRTQNGRAYIYKWGDYDQIKLKVDFVSGANANVINDWWDSNTELLFFINSGAADVNLDYSEVFSDYYWIRTTRGVTSEDYIKILEDTSSHTHYLWERFSITQNENIYYDVKLKKAGKNRTRIILMGGTALPTMNIYLDNGSHTISDSSYIIFSDVSSEADDFWRATFGVNISDISTVDVVVHLINSDGYQGYVGDGTSGIWAGDATLKHSDEVGTEVHSVFIANKTKPLAKYVKPYNTYLKGSITLEGY